MRLISEGFIWPIGITQPPAGQKQRAARYIILLILAALSMATFFFSLLRVF